MSINDNPNPPPSVPAPSVITRPPPDTALASDRNSVACIGTAGEFVTLAIDLGPTFKFTPSMARCVAVALGERADELEPLTPGGEIEVGLSEDGREVVINLPPGGRTGHITFSPQQARHLAGVLNRKADDITSPSGAPNNTTA